MAKIVIVSPDAPPQVGGVAKYIATSLAAVPGAELVVPEGFSYAQVARGLWSARGADEIWIHHVLPIGTVAWALRMLRLIPPYRLFFHGMDWELSGRNAWKCWLRGVVIGGALKVTANTQALAREIAGVVLREVGAVRPTIAAETFAAGVNTTRAYDAAQGGVRVLAVTRAVARKGVDRVVRAIVEVPEAVLRVIGDGPEQEVWKRLAQELGVADRVQFFGNMQGEELYEQYRWADIFALPTYHFPGDREGFGIVYLEASAFGLPTLAVRHPGVDEAVLHDVTGLLVADTQEAVTEGLRKLAIDPALCTRLGAGGQTFARTFATIERFKEELYA